MTEQTNSTANTAAGQSQQIIPPGLLWPFILLTSCFAWWGLANNMTDTLLAAFKRIQSMSDFQTSLIQIAFYGSYFCFALPAAIFIKKYSYKSGVLLGLALFIVGGLLFYPASMSMEYWHFLVALYILAGGLSILETAANPYIVQLGSAETGTRRLNLAQSFNPIGSIIGILLSKVFILSQLQELSAEQRGALAAEDLQTIQANELAAVMGPYVAVSILLVIVWLLIAKTKMPVIRDDGRLDLAAAGRRLFGNRSYRWGVFAQFCAVGAQIGVWSYLIRYVMLELSLNEEDSAVYYLASLGLLTVGRFTCTGLMHVFEPRKLLGTFAAVAVALCAVVMFVGGYVGVIALVAISGCLSLMFPTIYGLAVEGLGEDTKIGGSGLIMAILGGAVLTAIQGQVSDTTASVALSYVVPAACFAMIAFYGFVASAKPAS